MSLRGSEVAPLLAEFKQHFLDSRIQDLRQISGTALFLEVHGASGRHRCLLEAAAGNGRFHRVAERPPNAPRPPAFLAGCRKVIQGARVLGIEADPSRNMLTWKLQRAEETSLLILQWGRSTGLLALLDTEERVLVAVGRMFNGRSCTPGLRLVHPEPHDDPRPSRLQDTLNSPSEGIEDLYRNVESDTLRTLLVRGIRRERKRILRRRERIEADLLRADGADTKQRTGELLKGELHRMKRGMDCIEVTDWYAPGTPQVTIPLEPRLDGPANMARIFHEARRFKAARALIRDRLTLAENGLQKLDALETELEESTTNLESLRARAQRMGVLKSRKSSVREVGTTRLSYRTHRASDGTEILVGRGARDNENLTFQVARGNDLWFHARDRPGAHVILRCTRGKAAHPMAMEDAALLAAHGAKGGAGDTAVEVSWTERKHVRKVRGGAPGAVTVAGARTLRVRMDSERLERLLASREDGKPQS